LVTEQIGWIYETITEKLTFIIGQHITYKMIIIVSKMIDTAHYEICKMRLFAAEYMILIIEYYQIPTTGLL
jgi:hypothetical protein